MSEEAEERTAELEKRVAELEATVSGLTDELVDRTERIRALEEEVGVVAGAKPQSIITAGESDGSERESQEPKGTDESSPTPSEDDESDLLIPEPEDEVEDDTEGADKSPTSEGEATEGPPESTEDESPTDDIIVA